MGWEIPWYSSFETTFSPDFGTGPATSEPGGQQDGEDFSLSVFLREGEEVYRSYSTKGRGSRRCAVCGPCST